MTSQGLFSSIKTGLPSIRSCRELATTRVCSCGPLRANILVTSITFMRMDSTTMPFDSGESLMRDAILSPIAQPL